MPNLEKGGLQAGRGVMVWVIFLHTLKHLLPISCLFVIIVFPYTDNLSYQGDDDLCFLPVCVCVWVFVFWFFWGHLDKLRLIWIGKSQIA